MASRPVPISHRLPGASRATSSRKAPAFLPGAIWGVTAYFNPARYVNKLENLRIFAEGVRRQGLKLMIVEAALDGQVFEVPRGMADLLIQVRGGAVLWQRERLINYGVERLPLDCDKVVWLDSDALFMNDAWVNETADLLNDYAAVQPFSSYWSLPPGSRGWDYRVKNQGVSPGVAFLEAHAPSQTGFDVPTSGMAWGLRRSLIERHGLYDRCILGIGDAVQVCAMFGFSGYPFLDFFFSAAQLADARRWMQAFYEDVKQSTFYTQGHVCHLWHGNTANRGYTTRLAILTEENFDPATDIALGANGCWIWASDKTRMQARVRNYFLSRKEDTPEC